MGVQSVNIGTIANDGTGDTLRQAFNKVNENFAEVDLKILPTPERFGAIGDGVANDATAILNVFEYCLDNNIPLLANGTYLVNQSIPNFYDVVVYGSGKLRQSGVFWHFNPTPTDVNQLFVATGGSENNNGLSPSYPFQTIQQSFDVFAKLREVFAGRVIINIAAGTFTEGAKLPDYIPIPYLIIRGHPASGGVPTTIIDGTNANRRDGLSFDWDKTIVLKDIKVSNFESTVFASGIYCANKTIIDMDNVHTDTTCSIGVQIEKTSRLICTSGNGGMWHGSSHGFKAINLCGFTVDGAEISSALIQGMSNGHIDNSVIDGSITNGDGVEIVVNATVHFFNSTVKNYNGNRAAIYAHINSSFLDNGITYENNQSTYNGTPKFSDLSDVPNFLLDKGAFLR